MKRTLFFLTVFFPFALAVYSPIREYSGQNFFDGWEYYNYIDNTTWGNVSYVSQSTATSQTFTYVNSAGNAVLRVDNTTNIANATLVNRNTVRITTTDAYPVGSLVLIDLLHIPYGCSVWPSFWTLGSGIKWPNGGEIDIIEAVNLMNNNQMSIHTTPGCFKQQSSSVPAVQSGSTLNENCSDGAGCTVKENKQNSFGAGFANAGGGVYAMQFDVSGIYMWFWSRPDLPPSIKTATSSSSMDLTDWGLPTAAYPAASTCNLTQFFTPQQLVLDITLCGDWAGIPSIYSSTCPGTCLDNVIGSGNPVYNNAWFEIQYVRTYSATAAVLSSSSAAPTGTPGQSTVTVFATSTGAHDAQHTQSSSSAVKRGVVDMTFLLLLPILLAMAL